MAEKDFEQAVADLRAWDEEMEAAAFTEPHPVTVPESWFEELPHVKIRENKDFVLPWNAEGEDD